MSVVAKDPAYFGRPRREMLAQIPSAATAILDVGCGAGAFGAGLKAEWSRAGKTLTVWGLEMDPDAAARASEVLDKVLVGDATGQIAELPVGHFDVIVLNDILEHVVEPADLLLGLRPLLGPAGRIVASVPNVRHFPNLVDLVVHGRWEYTDEGILDRTHLRFFTRSSIVSLFADYGFTVESVEGINPTGSLKFKLVNILSLGKCSDMRYLQFAIRARVRGDQS